RRDQRLGGGHLNGQRVTEIIVGQPVGDQHGQSVRLLASGTACAPDAQGVIAVCLLVAKKIIKNIFVKQIQLRLIAEETGLVDGQILQQARQFVLALSADEQTVIAVKGVQLALP